MGSDTLVIVNRKARNGGTDLSRGLDVLRRAGWRVSQVTPDTPEGLPDLIRQRGPEMARIVIGGGDGTLNLAADALVEVGRPLGLIPLGTANDLARTLGIPKDPVDACRALVGGHLHQIDLGRVNGTHFFNVANIGLGVRAAKRLSKDDKRRWGVLAYLRSLYDAVKANRPFEVKLNIDGKEEHMSSIQLAIGNGRHFGGGLSIGAEARIDDHRLRLVSLGKQPILGLMNFAVAMHRDETLTNEHLIVRQGSDIRVSTDRPMDVNTDGEFTCRTPAHFSVSCNALSMYVPQDYPADDI